MVTLVVEARHIASLFGAIWASLPPDTPARALAWLETPCSAVTREDTITNCVPGLDLLAHKPSFTQAASSFPNLPQSFIAQSEATYGADKWVVKKANHGSVSYGGRASPGDIVQRRISSVLLRDELEVLIGLYVFVVSPGKHAQYNRGATRPVSVHVLGEPLVRLAPVGASPEVWQEGYVDAAAIWPGIEYDQVMAALISEIPSLAVAFEKLPNIITDMVQQVAEADCAGFELLRFDFMFDRQSSTPWLIEVNSGPNMHPRSDLQHRQQLRVSDQILTVLHDAAPAMLQSERCHERSIVQRRTSETRRRAPTRSPTRSPTSHPTTAAPSLAGETRSPTGVPTRVPTGVPTGYDTVHELRQQLSTTTAVTVFGDSNVVVEVPSDECSYLNDVAYSSATNDYYFACSQPNDEFVLTKRQNRAVKLRDRAYFHYQIGLAAISINGNAMATCQHNNNDYGGLMEANYFMGLSLYNLSLGLIRTDGSAFDISDPLQVPYLQHIDMLHETPDCMDLVSLELSNFDSSTTNDYLVFDAVSNQLVTVNFLTPHGPGVMDHSTADVRRLYGLPFTNGANINLAADLAREVAYVADQSANRVLAVDYRTGSCSRSARDDYPIYSSSASTFLYHVCEDVVWRVFASISNPVGIASYNSAVYVLADTGTASVLHTLGPSGETLATLSLDPGATRIRSSADSLLVVYPLRNHVKVLDRSSTTVYSSVADCGATECVGSIGSACSGDVQCVSSTCSSGTCEQRSPVAYSSANGLSSYINSASYNLSIAGQIASGGYLHTYMLMDADFCDQVAAVPCTALDFNALLLGNCWNHACIPHHLLCRNGGTLQMVGSAGYICDCSQTNHIGDSCETPEPTSAPTTEALVPVQHTIAFSSLSLSAWQGDTKRTYEFGYLHAVGLSTDGKSMIHPDILVDSIASTVRREGIHVAFTAQVPTSLATSAQTSQLDGAAVATSISIAANALGTAATVQMPPAGSISVVGSSSDASADDDSGKLSTTILIVIIVSSVVFVFATGAVVLYFKAPSCKKVAPATEQQDAVKKQDVVEKQKDECSIGIKQSQIDCKAI